METGGANTGCLEGIKSLFRIGPEPTSPEVLPNVNIFSLPLCSPHLPFPSCHRAYVVLMSGWLAVHNSIEEMNKKHISLLLACRVNSKAVSRLKPLWVL